MITHSIFTLIYVGGTYATFFYTWYKNIFCMIAVLIVLLAVNKKKEYDEKNIKTRQQQDRDDIVLLLVTR